MRPATITIDGKRLEAGWWGPTPDAAPTLVLLHEGLGSVALWRGFPALLATTTGRGVLAYSRFGYGHSDPVSLPRPLDYMHREALEVLPRVLDAAGVRRAVLIGHSDGASIAAIYVGSLHDARVRGLVLMAPHFFVEDISVTSIAGMLRDYEHGGLRARLARHHTDVDGAFNGWTGAWLDPGFRASFDLSREVRSITVPTLILQGRDDPYGTDAHARLAERLARDVRTAMLTVRHSPHVEATVDSVTAIAAFVAPLLGVKAAEPRGAR